MFKALLRYVRARFRDRTHHVVHSAHNAAHVVYLGAASLHGGAYGIAAGVLLVCVLLAQLLGDEAL